MYAYRSVAVLALTLAVSAQDPQPPQVPLPGAPGHDENSNSYTELASDTNRTITSYFGGEVPDVCTKTRVSLLESQPFAVICDSAYLELKAPARPVRGSLGGVYEPGIP
jgi:hypothetical protein